MRICGALQSPADQLAQVDNVGNAWVAGLTESSPGWQHLPCGNPGHVPDETRCPGRAPVDPPARWFGRCSCSGSAGGLGATLFFLRYLVTFHGAKLLSGVDVPSHVEWHHHLNGSISWVTLQGLISRISQVSHGSLSDEFRLNRQSRIMS